MKQVHVGITFKTLKEMIAIRAVLKAFDYKLFGAFECATSNPGEYDCVWLDGCSASRCKQYNHLPETLIGLEEFIRREGIKVKSPAQLRMEVIQIQMAELQKEVDALSKEL